MNETAVPIGQETICDVFHSYAAITLVTMLLLSSVTRELFFFMFSLCSQFFVMFIVVLREYIGVKYASPYCPETPLETNWPSVEQAQLGAFIGLIALYSVHWKCWHSFWITKAAAAAALFAVFIGLIILQVTEFFSAIVGFFLGVLFACAFLAAMRAYLGRCVTQPEFAALLGYTCCIDTLLCPKFTSTDEYEGRAPYHQYPQQYLQVAIQSEGHSPERI